MLQSRLPMVSLLFFSVKYSLPYYLVLEFLNQNVLDVDVDVFCVFNSCYFFLRVATSHTTCILPFIACQYHPNIERSSLDVQIVKGKKGRTMFHILIMVLLIFHRTIMV